MSIFTEQKRVGDWLKGEPDGIVDYCREKVTILAGESLVTGTVLGKITSSGKYVGYDVAATDGSQNAAAILYTDRIDGSTSADQIATAIVRGPCVISDAGLSWAADVVSGDKTAALAALKALGIINRGGA